MLPFSRVVFALMSCFGGCAPHRYLDPEAKESHDKTKEYLGGSGHGLENHQSWGLVYMMNLPYGR